MLNKGLDENPISDSPFYGGYNDDVFTPTFSYMITEAGDFIITEAGDFIVTE